MGVLVLAVLAQQLAQWGQPQSWGRGVVNTDNLEFGIILWANQENEHQDAVGFGLPREFDGAGFERGGWCGHGGSGSAGTGRRAALGLG